MPPVPTALQFWQALSPIIGWGIVLWGWRWIRADNNSREDRKERRNALNEIIKDIKELERRAYDYYLEDFNDKSVLQQVIIKRDQESIEKRLEHLRNTSGIFQRTDDLTAFRMQLTGGDFEAKNRAKLDPSNSKFLAISHSINTLIMYLEGEYTKLYARSPKA